MNNKTVVLWSPPTSTNIPSTVTNAEGILEYAPQLTNIDKSKVQSAFENRLYDMALEHVWRRTIVFLKQQLSSLGVRFIGEILSKSDVDDATPIDFILTEYEVINLSHELGIINSTAALKLKHLYELLNHYAKTDVQEEMSFPDAFQGLSTCVQFVLSSDTMAVAIDFANFRNRLENESISDNDDIIQQLKDSAYFFKRTTIRVLLALIKSKQSAQLENALSNFSIIVPIIWNEIKEPDRWNIGQTYAELSTSGKPEATGEIRKTLLTVNGFDYVPENLRSKTFIKIADKILQAHDGFDNYYNEPAPTEMLSKMGSTIPTPALQQCMTAILSVRLGNFYGKSRAAQIHARNLLVNLSQSRWEYYLNDCLPIDRRIIEKLMGHKPSQEWCSIVNEYELQNKTIRNRKIQLLIEFGGKNDTNGVNRIANELYSSIVI